MSTFHVLGAGAVGCLFAHHLLQRSVPVTLLLRSPDKLQLFNQQQQRLTVELPGSNGSHPSLSQTEATADLLSSTPRIENLLVTTKAYQTVPALHAIRHRLDASSAVVLLQNGVLGVYEEIINNLFPASESRPTFLLGSTTHGAYRKGDFHVLHAGIGSCMFGLPLDLQQLSSTHLGGTQCSLAEQPQQPQQVPHKQPGATQLPEHQPSQHLQQHDHVAMVLKVLESLNSLNVNVNITQPQLQQQLLIKLVANCCINPLTALLHCRNGGLQGNAYAETAWRGMISECKQVHAANLSDASNMSLSKQCRFCLLLLCTSKCRHASLLANA